MPSFIADDIVWAEVPIIAWLIVGIVALLITVGRRGWGQGQRVLNRYRLFWATTLCGALVAAVTLSLATGQPMPTYF